MGGRHAHQSFSSDSKSLFVWRSIILRLKSNDSKSLFVWRSIILSLKSNSGAEEKRPQLRADMSMLNLPLKEDQAPLFILHCDNFLQVDAILCNFL